MHLQPNWFNLHISQLGYMKDPKVHIGLCLWLPQTFLESQGKTIRQVNSHLIFIGPVEMALSCRPVVHIFHRRLLGN